MKKDAKIYREQQFNKDQSLEKDEKGSKNKIITLQPTQQESRAELENLNLRKSLPQNFEDKKFVITHPLSPSLKVQRRAKNQIANSFI